MATRIIRIPAFDAEIEWDEVEEKPTEFTPEHHEHEWVDILNEPEFAPATHGHSDYALATHGHLDYAPATHGHLDYAPATHGHSNYAPTSHNHEWGNITGFRAENPTGFDFNAALNSGFYSVFSAPNAPASGWVNLFVVRHPTSSSNNQFQIASPMLQNTDFYIRNLNPAAGLVTWRKFWHDANFLVSSGNWTPVLTVNNGAVLTYTTQTGSFVRQGKMCHLSFDLVGRLEEGSSSPTNAISINSNTNSLPFLPAKAAATPIKFFTGNLAHKIAATAGSNLLVFFRYQVSGANIIEAAYTWTNLLANSLTFQISGNISYEIA